MKLMGILKLTVLTVILLTSSACSMKDRSEVHSISVQLPQQWTNQSNSNMLIGPISTVADFDCYALNVTGPGINNDARMGCTNPSTAMGIVAGFIPVTDGRIEMMVPAGPNRKIEVIGIQSNVGCQILGALLDANGVDALNGMGTPYVIGSASTDLFDDASLDITVAYDSNAIAFQNCGNSNVPAQVAVTTPINGSYINNSNNTATFTVSGTCNKSGQPIDILIDGITVSSTTCVGGLFSKSDIDVTGLSDVPLIFSANMTTVELAVNSTNINVTKDTTAPNAATALVWGQASPTNNTSLTANWTKSTSPDLTTQMLQWYSDSGCTTASGYPYGLNSTDVTSNMTGNDGVVYSYKITSIDTAGNSTISSCSVDLTVDTTSPVTAITFPTNGSFINNLNNSISYVVSGFCSDDGDLVTIKFNGTPMNSAACFAGSFSIMVDTTGLVQGGYTISANILDAATNSGSSNISVTKDTIAPTTANSLTWAEGSPSAIFGVNTTWVKSASADLMNQKIMYYTDASCTSQLGGYINLNSTAIQTNAIAGINGDILTFKILSIDIAGNENVLCALV